MTGIPDWLEQKAKASEEKLKQTRPQKAEVIQLPLWKDVERTIPNHIARSSLFAPIARGRRKLHDKSLLVSRSDVKIYYTGKQLDEADCDVWMQLLHMARQVPLGDSVPVNRAEVLRGMGRKDSGYEYRMLHQQLERLWSGGLIIEAAKYQIGNTPRSQTIRLIDNFTHDPEIDTYILSIDKRWRTVYGDNEYSLIDWHKRLMISHRIDLAKRLQRLVATSSDKIQRYSMQHLKELCCHEGRMRDFRVALSDAMEELERLHIIKKARIETNKEGNEQACWQRIKE